jgi:hypothetical protein
MSGQLHDPAVLKPKGRIYDTHWDHVDSTVALEMLGIIQIFAAAGYRLQVIQEAV